MCRIRNNINAFLCCCIKIHGSPLCFERIFYMIFVKACIGHSENTAHSNCSDLPNIDTFHYTFVNITTKLIRTVSQRGLQAMSSFLVVQTRFQRFQFSCRAQTLSSGQTLPVFLQRTGSFSRTPLLMAPLGKTSLSSAVLSSRTGD